jgi:cobalt-zinc-cadmium efflux system protein
MTHNHEIHEYKFEKAIFFGIILNVAFIAIEVIFGLLADSIALISDAGHNLADVFSLLLAWLAAWMIKKRPFGRFTYGFKKGSIIIALVNSFLLLVAVGAIAWEAIHRFYTTYEVNGQTMIIVASAGVVINGLTAYLFSKGREKDLNIKSVFLHMLTDALVSIGVVVSGIIILVFKQNWVDPLISLVIVYVILYGTWGLLKDALNLSMDAVPSNIDLKKVKSYLESLSGVDDVHDLHIWGLSTAHTALTVHLVMDGSDIDNDFYNSIDKQLHKEFGIEHATIQVEPVNSKKMCLQVDCTNC